MRVYTAKNEDFESLQELYYAHYSRQAAVAEDYFVASYQDHDVFAAIVQATNGDVLVAEENGKPVGMAILSVTDRPLSPSISARRYVYVSSLIFESEEARDALLAEAELWAFALGIDNLQLKLHAKDSEAAKLYTDMGFSPEITTYSRKIPRESSPIGLPRGRVKLYPHCREWELEGERTITELGRLLPGIAIDLAHVGSTSVPTIPAKPIIDVAITVYDFEAILSKRELLQQHGYYYIPGASIDGQLLFAKGSFYDGTGDLQTHFIHVVKVHSIEWYGYLNFKRYISEFHDVAVKYARLKIRLARENSGDNGRKEYLAGKSDFIRDVIAKATHYYGYRTHIHPCK